MMVPCVKACACCAKNQLQLDCTNSAAAVVHDQLAITYTAVGVSRALTCCHENRTAMFLPSVHRLAPAGPVITRTALQVMTLYIMMYTLPYLHFRCHAGMELQLHIICGAQRGFPSAHGPLPPRRAVNPHCMSIHGCTWEEDGQACYNEHTCRASMAWMLSTVLCCCRTLKFPATPLPRALVWLSIYTPCTGGGSGLQG
jgi:hypothetical protein